MFSIFYCYLFMNVFPLTKVVQMHSSICLRYPIPKSQTVTSCCSLQKSTGLFANRSRPRERDLPEPWLKTFLVNEFSEFRTDDKFLVVALLNASYNLSVDTEAL